MARLADLVVCAVTIAKRAHTLPRRLRGEGQRSRTMIARTGAWVRTAVTAATEVAEPRKRESPRVGQQGGWTPPFVVITQLR